LNGRHLNLERVHSKSRSVKRMFCLSSAVEFLEEKLDNSVCEFYIRREVIL